MELLGTRYPAVSWVFIFIPRFFEQTYQELLAARSEGCRSCNRGASFVRNVHTGKFYEQTLTATT